MFLREGRESNGVGVVGDSKYSDVFAFSLLLLLLPNDEDADTGDGNDINDHVDAGERLTSSFVA